METGMMDEPTGKECWQAFNALPRPSKKRGMIGAWLFSYERLFLQLLPLALLNSPDKHSW